MGYTKLFSSILHSTVWLSGKDVQVLWITMLVLADRDGVVEASVPGLAAAARLSMEETETALAVLLQPDPYSRTKTDEGRRVAVVDGGWKLLNYETYDEKGSAEEAKKKARERQRRKRARNGESVTSVTSGDLSRQNVTKQRDVTVPDMPMPMPMMCEGGGPGEEGSITPADEARQLEQRRREVAEQAQQRAAAAWTEGYPVAPPCPRDACGKPLRLHKNSKTGVLFYCHHKDVTGCDFRCDAEELQVVCREKYERLKREGRI